MIHTEALVGLTDFVAHAFGEVALARSYRANGLAMHVEKRAPGFIPETSVLGFMEAAARLVGDEAIGLHFASEVSFADYGAWGDYLSQSETLGDCLTRLLRIVPLHTPYEGVRIRREGPHVWLRQYFPTAGEAHYNHLAWATIGAFVDLCRLFLGSHWQPLEIEMDIARPGHDLEYEAVFPGKIRFEASSLGIALAPEALAARRVGPGPVGPAVTFGDVLRERGPRRELGFPVAVGEAVSVQVRSGQVSIDDTARMFDMATRRFQRALERESLSFRDVATKARIARACALLQETSMPVKVVASELGYSHVQSFTRAFSARMQISPTAWRERQSSP